MATELLGLTFESPDLIIGRAEDYSGNLPFEELPAVDDAALAVVEAIADEEREDIYVEGAHNLRMAKDGSLADTSHFEDLQLTRYSLGQLAERVCPSGARPTAYLAHCPPWLRANNLNYWFPLFWEGGRSARKLLFRTRCLSKTAGGRQLYAVLSPRYGPLDIDLCASLILEEVPSSARAEVAVTDGRRMKFECVLEENVLPSEGGLAFRPALIFTTADDGMMGVKITAAMWSKTTPGSIILQEKHGETSVEEAREELVPFAQRHSRRINEDAFRRATQRSFSTLDAIVDLFKASWRAAEQQVLATTPEETRRLLEHLVLGGTIGQAIGTPKKTIAKRLVESHGEEHGQTTKASVVLSILRMASAHTDWYVWGRDLLYRQAGTLLLGAIRRTS